MGQSLCGSRLVMEPWVGPSGPGAPACEVGQGGRLGALPWASLPPALQMPVCSYFLKGICSNSSCPYSHVYVSRKAEVCTDFLKGYCPLGAKVRGMGWRGTGGEELARGPGPPCFAGLSSPPAHRQLTADTPVGWGGPPGQRVPVP